MGEPGSDPDAHSLEGRVIADRYFVEELLGAGAMGRVYRARHIHMQKVVALKVLHRSTSESPEIVSRFEREAVAAGRIDHPNVASATDFGRLDDGSFYLVLEFVEGESLGALLSQGALSVERAVGIARQIGLALAAAHHAGIVHRDLKPENVMLVLAREAISPGLEAGPRDTAPRHTGLRERARHETGLGDTELGETAVRETPPRETALQDNRVKVLDFGLAKLQHADTADTKLTMVGAVYGTPQYMSPEQAQGQTVDHRADLYALGLILYEMLAGRPPFESEQMMPLLIKQMTEVPPALPSGIPRELRALVSRLLEKAPDARFQSADEVVEALERLLSPGPRAPQRSLLSVQLPSADYVKSTARELLQRLWERLEGPRRALRGDVVVLGRTVPRTRIAVGLVALVFGFTLVLGRGDEEASAPGVSGTLSTSEEEATAQVEEQRRDGDVLDPELKKLIDAARAGSEAAASALELRDDDERTVSEWLALCQARLLRRKVAPALLAFEAAIKRDPSARSDKALVGMLRYLANDEEAAEPILRFVHAQLGAQAPDFLFDVWSGTSLKTPATSLAWKLLGTAEMKSLSSPALRIALELREESSCGARIPLLSRVEEVGDERCMLLLRDMKKDAPCEKRADEALDRALLQAGQRKAPRFPLLRRIRFKR